MIIKSLSIQNVKSIGEKINLQFDDGINIFIGPNAGGKSNIMDILNVVLNTYFIWHWHEDIQPYKKIRYFIQILENFFDLPEHDELIGSKNQEIELSLEFSKDDFKNIEIIKNNLSAIVETDKRLFSETQNEIENQFKPLLETENYSQLKSNLTQKFIFSALPLDSQTAASAFNSFNEFQKILFRYLNYFEKIKYLIEKHNVRKSDAEKIPDMKYMVKFFSANRFHETQNFEIVLPGQSRTQKLKELKEKTSSKTTSDIDYSTYFFAHKFNELDRNSNLFQSENQVKQVKKFLKLIGDYDFSVRTTSKSDNKYMFIIKSDNKEIEFGKLSSGEKEVFNFIFSIVALDLKNAVLIIDEPEIHLHPQWQNKLIDLYKEIARDRNLQFLISTHSPVFVNSDTISNIIRVYRQERQTKIIPEKKSANWKSELGKEQDLVDIITYSNNAKMFFTDTVVLVEGPTEEIIFSYLLDKLNKERKNIEVVPVNGKENFRKYIGFLKRFKIDSVVICDLDNLWSGKLLGGQSLVQPIREKINEFWRARDLKSLKPFLSPSTIRSKITNRVVGTRLFEIVLKIQKGKDLEENDKNFISHWLDKCIDSKKIVKELDVPEVYRRIDTTVTSLSDLISKLKLGITSNGLSSPVFILNKGRLEDYCDNVSHDKKGALKFLSDLKNYFRDKKTDNPKFEELKHIVSKILSISNGEKL